MTLRSLPYPHTLSDFTELIEILFPGNRNQQHAGACIFYELKRAEHIVANLAQVETRYHVSRRTLQRTRAKLARLRAQQFGDVSNDVVIDNVVPIFWRSKRAVEGYVWSVVYGWIEPLLEC